MDIERVILAVLYLQRDSGGFALPQGRWPSLISALRRSAPSSLDVRLVLQRAGYEEEAAILSPSLCNEAELLIAAGRVLTGACDEYPHRWLSLLGGSAPPVLWKRGDMPGRRFISIVGSREVPPKVYRFCRDAARAAVSLRYSVVSGGAMGCDRAAAVGAGANIVEILPFGLGRATSSCGCQLSICPPSAEFSSAAAMRRNALIYAASTHTVVGACRFKVGGTWQGAAACLRARSSQLLVRREDDLASRALVALGGKWMDRPYDLSRLVAESPDQRDLFLSAI